MAIIRIVNVHKAARLVAILMTPDTGDAIDLDLQTTTVQPLDLDFLEGALRALESYEFLVVKHPLSSLFRVDCSEPP